MSKVYNLKTTSQTIFGLEHLKQKVVKDLKKARSAFNVAYKRDADLTVVCENENQLESFLSDIGRAVSLLERYDVIKRKPE